MKTPVTPLLVFLLSAMFIPSAFAVPSNSTAQNQGDLDGASGHLEILKDTCTVNASGKIMQFSEEQVFKISDKTLILTCDINNALDTGVVFDAVATTRKSGPSGDIVSDEAVAAMAMPSGSTDKLSMKLTVPEEIGVYQTKIELDNGGQALSSPLYLSYNVTPEWTAEAPPETATQNTQDQSIIYIILTILIVAAALFYVKRIKK